jgi:mannan endo-1,4-beta-mannosidase
MLHKPNRHCTCIVALVTAALACSDPGGGCDANGQEQACPIFDPSHPERGFCTADCPCATGQGDCDNDSQCEADLICGVDNGPFYGLPSGYDACAFPDSCGNGLLEVGEQCDDGNADRGDGCDPDCQQEMTTELALAQLRNTLTALATDSHLAFGQQDTTAYGVGWRGEADRSDVKSVCGAHPAVYGWDLDGIGNEENLDGVSFAYMQTLVREAYDRGGLNTVSWHMRNPVTGEDAWDVTPAVDAIVPGGSHHDEYRAKLDRVADFLLQCQGDAGELIPIIFRPFHEHTGNWFWWGEPHCTDSDYVALWVFTVEYLRDEKGLDSLLFAFSPWGSGIASESDYLFRYPGDDYVDVFGVDYYFGNSDQRLVAAAEIAVALAQARGKVAAITEFGVPDGLSADNVDVEHWFTQDFLNPILASPEARRVAYGLTWRNARTDHFFVPYPGHEAEADFRIFCADPFVLLQSDLPLPP